MTSQKQNMLTQVGTLDPEQVQTESHIERESAAYINGTKPERESRVRQIWAEILGNPSRFRSPGHYAPSAPLHSSTLLDTDHSELGKETTPVRHIYYFDSLTFDLDKNKVQARLERKQKIKGLSLKEAFDAVTVKIGDKAQSRIEETVRVDLDTWKEQGFYAALKAGMRAEVAGLKNTGEQGKAKKRAKVLKALKQALIDAVGHQELKDLEAFPLTHLVRSTIETSFSPAEDADSLVEPKTDMCESVSTLSHIRSFSQFEIESIEGDFAHAQRIMQEFCANAALNLTPTSDSKADPSFADLRPWLVPQNGTPAEELRVRGNRTILKNHLDPVRFQTLDTAALGLVPATI